MRCSISSNTSHINYQIESWEDLRQWFRAHLESQRRFGMTRGCPLGTIGNEITEDDNLTQQDLKLIFVVMHNKLATFFIREKAKGLLSKYASEDDMAHFCIAAIQGAMLKGKIRRSSETVETIGQEALAHLGTYAVSASR